MEHEIWCLYGNILILLPHSSTYTLVKCRKVSVNTIIDLYIHWYNNTDIWEPPNWSTYCLMFNDVTFIHDYLRQQRSQNPMNSSCCNTCQTWTKWCNKSLVTRLIFQWLEEEIVIWDMKVRSHTLPSVPFRKDKPLLPPPLAETRHLILSITHQLDRPASSGLTPNRFTASTRKDCWLW